MRKMYSSLLFISLIVFTQGFVSDGQETRSADAGVARYIIQNSDWVSFATLSQTIEFYPFVAVKSISDGTKDNSTGVPYFYETDIDISAQDLAVVNRLAIAATLAQSSYCKENDLDPQNPQCPRVYLVGQHIKLDPESAEYEFAKQGLIEKHPEMAHWPEEDEFYVAKLEIEHIYVMYEFGGLIEIELDDYYQSEPQMPGSKI